MELSDANRRIGLRKEGIPQAKEALSIYKRLGDTAGLKSCLIALALLLCADKQLDAAEEAASRVIAPLPEKDDEYQVCQAHQVLGKIFRFKGEMDKAIHHIEAAIRIASSFNWHDELFWSHYGLADLFYDGEKFDDAQTHIEHAKSYTNNNIYCLGYATEEQAWIWYQQDRPDEARSEALRAADIYENLGAANDLENCRNLLQYIEEELNTPVASG